MIQRLQSVYLFLTTLLSILFLNGTLLSFINKSGLTYNLTFLNITKVAEGQAAQNVGTVWPLSIILVLIIVLSVICILLYKNRTRQLLFSKILIGLILVLILIIVYYTYSITSQYDTTFVPGIKMVIPVLMLAFSVLAFRGIKKDDQLVKSYDRLR
jgi:hypothetical protein